MRLRPALEAFPDVIPFFARAGQILVYPRHTPPGIFVVVRGALRRFVDASRRDGHDRFDSASGPFAIPGPGELRRPAQAGVVADTDVEILFLPRSLVLRDESIARLLATAGVPTVPLQHRRAG